MFRFNENFKIKRSKIAKLTVGHNKEQNRMKERGENKGAKDKKCECADKGKYELTIQRLIPGEVCAYLSERHDCSLMPSGKTDRVIPHT